MTYKAFILNILILTCFGTVSGQDSVFVFKVKKPESVLSVSFKDTFLIKGENYLFEIKVKTGKKRVARVLSDSLKIRRAGKNLYSISVPKKTRIRKAMLRIFLQKEDGKIHLEKLITYKIIAPEKPIIYVGGVKADSVIDKRHLYDNAKLHGIYKGFKVRVLSFELVSFGNGNEIKMLSNNNSLTVEMKQFIQKLAIGSTIYFNNVSCLLPNGKVMKIETIRLFFDETNKYKIGNRIINRG